MKNSQVSLAKMSAGWITCQEEPLCEIGIDTHKALTDLHVKDEKQQVFYRNMGSLK